MSSATLPEAPTTTREALLAAGRGLLLSKQAFSMGAAAKAAGVSRQAVYLHFADRYALLEAVVDEAAADSAVNVSRDQITSAATACAALALLLETVVRISRQHGAVDQAVRHTLASDPKLADRWAKRRGRGAMIRLVAGRLESEGALRPEGATARACETALHGFTSPEAVLPLSSTLAEADTVELLQRAVSAAVLRANKRIPKPQPRS